MSDAAARKRWDEWHQRVFSALDPGRRGTVNPALLEEMLKSASVSSRVWNGEYRNGLNLQGYKEWVGRLNGSSYESFVLHVSQALGLALPGAEPTVPRHWNEFHHMAFNRLAGGREGISPEGLQTLARVGGLPQVVWEDVDGDGIMSWPEYKRWLHKLSASNPATYDSFVASLSYNLGIPPVPSGEKDGTAASGGGGTATGSAPGSFTGPSSARSGSVGGAGSAGPVPHRPPGAVGPRRPSLSRSSGDMRGSQTDLSRPPDTLPGMVGGGSGPSASHSGTATETCKHSPLHGHEDEPCEWLATMHAVYKRLRRGDVLHVDDLVRVGSSRAPLPPALQALRGRTLNFQEFSDLHEDRSSGTQAFLREVCVAVGLQPPPSLTDMRVFKASVDGVEAMRYGTGERVDTGTRGGSQSRRANSGRRMRRASEYDSGSDESVTKYPQPATRKMRPAGAAGPGGGGPAPAAFGAGGGGGSGSGRAPRPTGRAGGGGGGPLPAALSVSAIEASAPPGVVHGPRQSSGEVTDTGRTWCICNPPLPENFGGVQIFCYGCGYWLHARCLGLADESQVPPSFICPRCQRERDTADISTAHVSPGFNPRALLQRLVEPLRGVDEPRHLPPGTLSEQDVVSVLLAVRDSFMAEPMLVDVQAPVCVIGDTHGQYFDTLRIFRTTGFPVVDGVNFDGLSDRQPRSDRKFLFLGDYVDRGQHSVENLTLLLLFKLLLPSHFVLLRGNHECTMITQTYGFYEECKRKYSVKLWRIACEMFNCMPIAAVVSRRVFACHGGISPQLRSLDDIRRLGAQRPCEPPPQSGLMLDILWSDPDTSQDDWRPNDTRGCSWKFGRRVLEQFLAQHGLDIVVRAHEVQENGYGMAFNRQVITIFSAPNYCGEYDNPAAILTLSAELRSNFQLVMPASTTVRPSGFAVEPGEVKRRPREPSPIRAVRLAVGGPKAIFGRS